MGVVIHICLLHYKIEIVEGKKFLKAKAISVIEERGFS